MNTRYDAITNREPPDEVYVRMLTAAVERSPILIGLADGNGRLTYVNRALQQTLQFSLEELAGQPFSAILSQNNSAELQQEITAKTFEPGGFRGECLVPRKDGTDVTVLLSSNSINDGEGRVIGAIGIAQDITERKQSEELQRTRESELMQAQRIGGMGSFLWTLATGTLGWSSGLKDVLRRDSDLPTPTFDELARFYTPESWGRLIAAAEKVIRTGVPDEIEAEMIRDDGTTCWTTLRGEVRRGPDGSVVAIQGTVLDIDKRKRSEDEILLKTALLEAQAETSIDGILAVDEANKIILSNQLFATIWGVPSEMLRRGDDKQLLQHVLNYVENRQAFIERVEYLYSHREEKSRDEVQLKDGRTFDRYSSPLVDSAGRYLGRIWYFRDITERIRSEQRMQLWSKVLEQSAEGIVICDPQERILLVNKAFEQSTGFSANEVLGQTPRILQSGRQGRAFYADMWRSVSETGSWQGELWNRRKNGEIFAEWLSISAVHDQKTALTHYVGIFSDITDRKHDAERIAHLAHYDALTDLPNRALLMDRLKQLTKAARRRKSKLALVFIDLDRFKDVNDSLGHDAGDVLLQTIAKRFSSVMRGEDTVARIGGDEFVAVFQEIHDGQDASIIARELFSCLREPVALNGYELTVTASMGISIYPDDAGDGQEMIRNADAAMYQAKSAGRNACQFYTSDLNQRALEMLSMESGLRRAIENQEFVLYYQPQVDIVSGSVVGAEALIRWKHPDFGLVMPGKFISIAEERGLIVPIGSWVIDEAARQAAAWQDAGTPIRIAVNVSAIQFRQKEFVEQLENSVRKHGIMADNLELELTERIVMRDAEATIKVLDRLHKLGFRLSIDDFGTGYSSLSYLRRFPMDKIKIDQSFVKDGNAGSIVSAIINLARSLNLRVIGEGVETKEQLELLRELGCNEAQGFLFSAGLVAGEFEKLIRQREKPWD